MAEDKSIIDRRNAYKLEWRNKNIEKTRQAEQAYRERNRDACNARIREWKRRNSHRVDEYRRARQIAQLNATPAWANKSAMLEFYAESKRRQRESGAPHHVDHIVPIVHPLVCGLHCESNLQILPRTENAKKNNRYWPDMP